MSAASPQRPAQPFELGLHSFVEWTADPITGKRVSPQERLHDLLEEIILADQLGLDVFGIGEHHRAEYLASAPVPILAAAATRTSQIRLSSAVTVLSSDDPVRVFQDFSTLDLLSGGRAEIMVGRGSFIESFPLFGYDLDDYDALFEEKLELLLELRATERVTWSGTFRPSLEAQPVYPRPRQKTLPIWIAVGGTPASATRAGKLGLPLALAIIGGMPEQFAPLLERYRRAGEAAGFTNLPVSVNAHAFIADTSQLAADTFYPAYAQVMTQIGRERGWSPMTRQGFESLRSPRGALLVGSPEEIAEKILRQHEIFGHQRFLAQMTVGTLPHSTVMRAIELFGTEVAPIVRAEIARRARATEVQPSS